MQNISVNKKSLWLNQKTIYVIFFIVINALNIQSVITNKMNVWKIFRQGYFHLSNHTNLYDLYPNEYFDYYLYSPSFAVMFAPFSIIPNYTAYFFWNNINMLIVPYLIFKLKGIDSNKKSIICYMALIEMGTCLQGTQTNVMIASLMLITFISFENRYYWIAAFAIAAGFYIKIFPIVAASLFFLYPNKLNFLVKLAASIVIIGVLPLLFIKPAELYWQYQNWVHIIVEDQADKTGRISVTGFLQTCFNISNRGKLLIQTAGVIIFCLMYIRRSLFKQYYYRLYFLCAMLIWVVIFNHAAEIYSYTIAILGLGIWYVIQQHNKYLNIFICLFIFFTSILTIDPTPHFIIDYIFKYSLKSLPYAILFLVMVYEMTTGIRKPISLTKV